MTLINAFFLQTKQSGPAAAGEWRSGRALYREYIRWAHAEDSHAGRMAFYADLRALGFNERRSPQVMFFAPKRAQRSRPVSGA